MIVYTESSFIQEVALTQHTHVHVYQPLWRKPTHITTYSNNISKGFCSNRSTQRYSIQPSDTATPGGHVGYRDGVSWYFMPC